MDNTYKINNATRFAMLSVALMFDALQLVTPQSVDKVIMLLAAIIFMMWFAEKGALVISNDGALKLFIILVPFAEFFMSVIPGITLTVWIQIKISRIADRIISEDLHKLVELKHLPGDVKNLLHKKRLLSHNIKQVRKFARARSARSIRRLARQISKQQNRVK